MPLTADQAEEALQKDIAGFTHDPLGYVLYAFTWGKGELKDSPGPRTWQRELLVQLGEDLRAGKVNNFEAIQYAVASGHGIGKSALVAMLVMWAMSTCEDTRGIITANTKRQLTTKTWPELEKWARRAINSHWFTVTKTRIESKSPGHEATWGLDQMVWTENKTEAFAGLHNLGKRILVIFDESSAIPDAISEEAEGALTDENTEILWFKFGNPTRNTGQFKDCFGRKKHRWKTRQIDSRNVEGTNKRQIQKWLEDHGEDSDFFRVRVKGVFPNASVLQFIPGDLVAAAMKREVQSMYGDPLIMTLDVARGGADDCVFYFRRGLDARSIPPVIVPGMFSKDSMVLCAKAVDLFVQYEPDAFFIDETGMGGPVVDRIRQLLPGRVVIGVQFAGESSDPHYANMRADIWRKCREWLKKGAIWDDPRIEMELTAPEFHHDRWDKIVLESKDDMKERGEVSPDVADALCMSFAYPVAPKGGPGSLGQKIQDARERVIPDPSVWQTVKPKTERPGDFDPRAAAILRGGDHDLHLAGPTEEYGADRPRRGASQEDRDRWRAAA